MHAALRLPRNQHCRAVDERKMASWVQNMGLSKGSHLVEGSTLMPKWEDRSGIAIAENNINLLPKNVAQDPMLAKGALFEIHGDQETFNLHQMLYEKTFESEYFKALFFSKWKSCT